LILNIKYSYILKRINSLCFKFIEINILASTKNEKNYIISQLEVIIGYNFKIIKLRIGKLT